MCKQNILVTLILGMSLLFSFELHAADPLEYKLACINANEMVSKDHITVTRFRSLLNQLSKSFSEDKESIADMSAKTRELLSNEGINESLLNIMEGINRIVSINGAKRKYAHYAAAYLMLRKMGYGHNETLNSVRAAMN